MRISPFHLVIRIAIVGVCVSWCGVATVSAQFQQNMRRSLFSDMKALNVGDAVTISIVENTEADNNALADEQSALSLGGSVNTSIPGSPSSSAGGTLNTTNNFRGRGQNTRSERIRSRLSARVDSVDAVGNLRIRANRVTKVNGEMQTITLTGFVRPVDILDDNSVLSSNILDLNLLIEGDGNVTRANQPGLITKFLRFLF
jgi:flagellar L-ring protein precursor FlgH